MGSSAMKFYFCDKCGKRLTEKDIAEGLGKDKKLRGVFCSDCSEGVLTMDELPMDNDEARRLVQEERGQKPSESAAASSAALGRRARRPPSQRLGDSRPGQRSPAGFDRNASTRTSARSRGRGTQAPSGLNPAVIWIGGGLALVVVAVLVWASTSKQPNPGKKTAKAKSGKADAGLTRLPGNERKKQEAAPKPEQKNPNESPKPGTGRARETGGSMADLREELAARNLAEAKAFRKANPDDPWTYQKKLKSVAGTYSGTAAGDEAAKMLSELVVPEKPEMVGVGEWKKIFDGTSPALFQFGRGNWTLTGGALQNTRRNDALLSRATFGDGEFRFRFEVKGGVSGIYFKLRHGSGGVTAWQLFKRRVIDTWQGRVNELIFLCNGTDDRATFNGEPAEITQGGGREGRIQINASGGVFRLLSVEHRAIGLKK